MNAASWLRAALIPVSNLGVLLTVVVFWLLLLLVQAAGVLGIWLAVVILPAWFRYLSTLVEAIGRGQKVAAPDGEFFRWTGDAWSLFPVVVFVFAAWAAYWLYDVQGTILALAFLTVLAILYPAILGVLAITHSPLQAINPVALGRFIGGIGPTYVVALLHAVIVAGLVFQLSRMPVLSGLIEMMLICSLHTVIGQMIKPHGLFDNIYIADALEDTEQQTLQKTEQQRAVVLSHAYGFVSRDNRDGGFDHIIDAIQADDDPAGAWAWFFERMTRWEQPQHALFFAQRYIHDLLSHGDDVPALKLILRCRLLDAGFKPATDDIAAAVAAAERNGNIELAAVLKGS